MMAENGHDTRQTACFAGNDNCSGCRGSHGVPALIDFYLASASPRRKEILTCAGVQFKAVPVDVDETMNGPVDGEIRRLALKKARAAVEKYGVTRGVVLGCDTVVAQNGEIFGKPADEQDAFRMLSCLQNAKHTVISGICLLESSTGLYKWDTVYTDVFIRAILPEQIRAYIATGEPMDKAGAYAIQGIAGKYVWRIEGCYYNVVGLPLSRMFELMDRPVGSLERHDS